MNQQDRALAAKRFLQNPLMKALLEEMRQGHLEAIAASALPDVEKREYSYTATRVIAEMQGQLELWAKEAK